MAKKIMVVDDELDILKTVSYRLEKLGYKILQATNGNEALNIMAKDKPDLVLLDLSMPVMGGYEVCRRMKIDENLKDIPIIFLTVSRADKVSDTIVGPGADDHITKPFESEELIKKVKKFLK